MLMAGPAGLRLWLLLLLLLLLLKWVLLRVLLLLLPGSGVLKWHHWKWRGGFICRLLHRRSFVAYRGLDVLLLAPLRQVLQLGAMPPLPRLLLRFPQWLLLMLQLMGRATAHGWDQLMLWGPCIARCCYGANVQAGALGLQPHAFVRCKRLLLLLLLLLLLKGRLGPAAATPDGRPGTVAGPERRCAGRAPPAGVGGWGGGHGTRR
jgi:hypothetical protein